MFEKLLAVIPYNPGLIPQMSFYSRRMREETSIRRTGMIFLTLAFMIQFFAVLSPPQSTMASSDNDLITGGISSAADAKRNCLNNTRGFMRIMHYYGIRCTAFNNAETLTIHTGARNYYSMGHNLSSGKDTPVNINGAGKLYWRPLSTWHQASWKVLRVRDQDNKVFYVIYDCGNLVSVGIPSASPLKTVEATPEVAPAPTPAPTPVSTATPAPTPAPVPTSSPPPCEYNSLLSSNDINCKPCDKSLSSQDKVACIDVRKTASNVTAGVGDANNTTAQAGDVINYTLFAENKGKAAVEGFTFQENLSDVLDYADITNLHGGSLNTDKTVGWPPVNIKAGATATVQITVKVKDPIPQTPTSSSDPNHFDLIMTNVYGNSINIKLPGSPIKQVEVTAAALPNAGPGTTLFVAATIVIIAGYFYGRAGLLARESKIVVKETAAA